MYKLCFFVPETHLEQVKSALFSAGAGRIGNYDSCSWQTRGVGQFRALTGSDPYCGEQGQLELVDEYKVEMVCESKRIESVVDALKGAHPYETPAYEVFRLESF